jgi:V/A-type H+-transporting ATPase subunit I
MPAESEDRLIRTAKESNWGVLVRDPKEDDQVPTLLRPAPGFKPMQSLFSVLGINPAYNEADVSVPFFCFFSIFFAMLVGDGGYGALILLMTLYAAKKFRKAPRSPFILLTVFSVATVIWGVLTNTWFGFHPAAINNPVSDWLTNLKTGDGNMMLVCFTLGVIHLSIARIWNAVRLFPNTKFLAEVGWVGIIWFMYFTAGSVVGVLPSPGVAMKCILGISILLIACFMLKKEELKTEGANLGMLPLNIISCLGDIISYVRLFAVGLASVKVAENFNSMALGLDMHLVFKLPCMILILLLGHGLNFAMAGLSVLVHAVRLNTLEFSNHKGITWSGFAFNPFKRSTDTQQS